MDNYTLYFWVDPNEDRQKNPKVSKRVTIDQYNMASKYANGETNYKNDHVLYISKNDYMTTVMNLIQ